MIVQEVMQFDYKNPKADITGLESSFEIETMHLILVLRSRTVRKETNLRVILMPWISNSNRKLISDWKKGRKSESIWNQHNNQKAMLHRNYSHSLGSLMILIQPMIVPKENPRMPKHRIGLVILQHSPRSNTKMTSIFLICDLREWASISTSINIYQ